MIMEPISITSPRNKAKVMIGEMDYLNRTAYFYITEKRYFKEANAIGIDLKVFNRKSVRWCNQFIFELWDKRKFKISREDFVKNAWIYPPGANPDYKAAFPDFVPKLVITIETAEKLNTWSKEEEGEEILKAALR